MRQSCRTSCFENFAFISLRASAVLVAAHTLNKAREKTSTQEEAKVARTCFLISLEIIINESRVAASASRRVRAGSARLSWRVHYYWTRIEYSCSGSNLKPEANLAESWNLRLARLFSFSKCRERSRLNISKKLNTNELLLVAEHACQIATSARQ